MMLELTVRLTHGEKRKVLRAEYYGAHAKQGGLGASFEKQLRAGRASGNGVATLSVWCTELRLEE